MTHHVSENKVLRCIARRKLSPDKQAELRRLLKEDLNWDYLILTANVHGLTPLIQKNLSTTAPELVPSWFLARLKRESVANTQSVLHLIGKLRKVHHTFAENGIRVATFKGPVLAQMAYGEISLRQAGDIDLLIDRRHFERAKLLLESLGYQMSPQLTPAQQSSHLGFHCEIQFMRDDWFTVVDLHWNLTPKSFVFKLAGEEVMSRLQPFSFAGAQIETFGKEDLILYQSFHGAKHAWRRLEWICSLAELLRPADSIDWDTLVQRAASAYCIRMLGLGLRLVERFSDVKIDKDVLSAVDANRAMQRVAGRVEERLFVPQSALADLTESNLSNFTIMDRKRDALASRLRAILVPTLSDWEALKLPAALHPLYYAFRPLRLSKVYGTSLLRKIK